MPSALLWASSSEKYFYFGVLKSLRAFQNPFFTGGEPSQALPRQLPRRGSQDLKPAAKALGETRKFPGVLLALPLGELSPQVTERAHAVRL